MRLRSLALAALSGAAGLAATAAAAEMRAVVIGIDDYVYERRLLGAVADATDIQQALERRGTKDLTALINRQASRTNVLAALDGLVARVAKGDLVFITYAGHGSREAWGDVRPPDAKKGDLHSVILMPEFKAPVAGRVAPADRRFAAERVSGREITDRIRLIEAKGAETIYITDTCHGGGLTRSLAIGAPRQSYRSGSPYSGFGPGDDPLAAELSKTSNAFAHLQEMPNVTFLAAVDELHTAPEVTVPGQTTKRGALSYGIARALEGEGDADGDGKLTRRELFTYLRANISTFSHSEQVPELQPADDGVGGEVVFTVPERPAKPAPVGGDATIKVFVDGGEPLPSGGGGVRLTAAASKEGADLIWRSSDGAVISEFGDVVATGLRGADLPAVGERVLAIRALTLAARDRQFPLAIRQGNDRHRPGAKVDIVTDAPHDGLYYAMFNIAGDGTVQYLYPIPSKGDAPKLGTDPVLQTSKVVPPYGSDFLIVVTSPDPIDGLVARLVALDGQRTPMAAAQAVAAARADGVKIGVQGLFTGN
jgi:hypothetical protein